MIQAIAFAISLIVLTATSVFAQEVPKGCAPAITVLEGIDSKEAIIDGGTVNPEQLTALLALAGQTSKKYDFAVVLAHGDGVFGWVFGFKVDDTGANSVLCAGGHVPKQHIQAFLEIVNSNAKKEDGYKSGGGYGKLNDGRI